ncbi:hypothetical protein AX16_000479 [Volvariella volvacea WC 439]|nr:hypothetical protein AX16_000479 [Volvariella volvacea WC 439]
MAPLLSPPQFRPGYAPYYIRPVPAPEPSWPMPRLGLRIDDLEHSGYEVFRKAVDPVEVLKVAVLESFEQLYSFETVPRHDGLCVADATAV